MLSFGKTSNEKALNLKALSRFLFCISTIVFGITFNSKSTQAQIENLYNEQTDQVAGITSLMSAVVGNDIDGVRFFSKSGSAILNQKNSGGATALHIACREKNLEAVKILLENKADVNVSDNEDWTPIMRASLAGESEIVRLLLENNAQANNLNSVKESAIIHAASSDCFECLNLMLEKFNFIKLMNFELLKNQLSLAYNISQNHDKKEIQNLISAYLDKSIKMSSLVDSDEEISEGLKDEIEKINEPYEFISAPIYPSKDKKFRFVSKNSSNQKEIKNFHQIDEISISKKETPNLTKRAKTNQDKGNKVYKFLSNNDFSQKQEALPIKAETDSDSTKTIEESELPKMKVFNLKKGQEADSDSIKKVEEPKTFELPKMKVFNLKKGQETDSDSTKTIEEPKTFELPKAKVFNLKKGQETDSDSTKTIEESESGVKVDKKIYKFNSST